MGKHLTADEQALVDRVIKKQRLTPNDAFIALAESRRKHCDAPPAKTTLYRYLKGETHKRNRKESRGRPKSLRRSDVRKLMNARRRLIKAADNEYRVTYKDTIVAAGLEEASCQRTITFGAKNRILRQVLNAGFGLSCSLLVCRTDAKQQLLTERSTPRKRYGLIAPTLASTTYRKSCSAY